MTNQKKCPACGKMYTPEKGKSHYACEDCTQQILKNIMEAKELPRGVKKLTSEVATRLKMPE
jgi:predicted RNA-binding Zn-ribbon protein involved in translation (DUF1610 family)